jgi:hypothetical protein
VDSTNVYWTDNGDVGQANGSVLTCPLAGCAGAPKVLAAGELNPFGIAVDSTRIYWVNEQGEAKSLAK